MRREGRQGGLVRTYDRALGLIDPDTARRAVYVVDGAAATNGSLVRAPAKPTHHSKFTGCDPYGEYAKVKRNKGRNKFKHDEIKTHRLDLLEGADDDDGADNE